MREAGWQKIDRERREARARSERRWKAAGTAIGILLFLAILALVLWMRHSAPCWIFPLAEAPSRCLVVNPR